MADTLETYGTVTPYLVVANADAELKFIAAAFGAVEALCHRDDKNATMHAELKIGDSLMMLGQAGDQMKALTAALYLWVPNVDAVYAKALALGATSLSAP
jgi:PhnB protein